MPASPTISATCPSLGSRAIPAMGQRPQLVIASDEGGQVARGSGGFEPSTRAVRTENAIKLERLGNALERLGPRSSTMKPRNQAIGRGGAEHGIGSSLDAGSDVWRVAKNVSLGTGANIDYHQAGVDIEARVSRKICCRRECFENREACANRPFGIIFVCAWIAEEGHHSITEIFGDVAAEPYQGLSGSAMVSDDGRSPILRVEGGRDNGRVGEVAEQYC
jgi:hypothetical protein